MNESNQPFTDHVTRAKSSPKGARIGWGLFIVMAVAVVVLLGLWKASSARVGTELAGLQSALDGAKADLAAVRAENRTNREVIAGLTNQVAALQKEKELASQASRTLEDEMRSE